MLVYIDSSVLARAYLPDEVAVATLAALPLLDPGAALGLASRSEAQRQAGIALGFVEV